MNLPRVGAQDGGSTLSLRVSPGARKERVLGVFDGALKIAVAAPPERGRANDAACAFVARLLGLPRGDVDLVAGETTRTKRVRVALQADEVRARLSDVLVTLGDP